MAKAKDDLYVRIYPNPDTHSVNPYRVDLMEGEEKKVLRTAENYFFAWLIARMMLIEVRAGRRKAARVKKYKERIIR